MVKMVANIVAEANVSTFTRARNNCCGHKICVRDTKYVSDFFQKHFVYATSVAPFARQRNIMSINVRRSGRSVASEKQRVIFD